MRKSVMIIFLVLLGLSLFAQNTNDTMGDICIPYPVIKSIQTDLLIGDSAKAMLSISNTESILLKKQIFDQANAIDNYKASDINLKAQIKNLNEQMIMYKGSYVTLENNFNILSKEHRKTKVKNKVWNIILITGSAVLAGEMLYYRELYRRHR
jgi:hypothetical protein